MPDFSVDQYCPTYHDHTKANKTALRSMPRLFLKRPLAKGHNPELQKWRTPADNNDLRTLCSIC
jgi:hypothetical protein